MCNMAPFSALNLNVFVLFLYTILTAALIKFYGRMNLHLKPTTARHGLVFPAGTSRPSSASGLQVQALIFSFHLSRAW